MESDPRTMEKRPTLEGNRHWKRTHFGKGPENLEKTQGRDPSPKKKTVKAPENLEKKTQGRDPRTLGENRQEKDPGKGPENQKPRGFKAIRIN